MSRRPLATRVSSCTGAKVRTGAGDRKAAAVNGASGISPVAGSSQSATPVSICQAGDGADNDPEQNVAQPSPDADAKAAAEGNPGVDQLLARRRWMAAVSHVSPAVPEPS